ncbi:Fe(3+) ABC transporter substrate-binding protein [Proteiniclasticum sp. SCR006]|uniref:Fe(3+) ABC transporter substrate-binding protein n=1 Tax=Proteiniclasticum aestuarii TaxID=2817862 RepID=A0A939HBQ1_9CLOT|nr:Fe(3+) ABC transporter substrate-binding protein [Proteiniclasticum aestuarii]MBO1265420.1 Fe(3+) ABC transporter substrate-binding protein [Proteiniclasticum aestuarii]
MKKLLSIIIVGVLVLGIMGCEAKEENVVNIYTDRHYDTDQALYDQFTEKTGITVNVVKAGSDELLERLSAEGEDTEADLLVTSDVGRLYRAGERGIIKAFDSDVVESNVPENLRGAENLWTALTVRARVITYVLDKVDPGSLSTYEALTEPEWEGRVLVRSSDNIYNQSLLASFIALNGEEAAKEWAEGIVANMARTPQGNDRDQMKAIVAGEGDVAIVNTYYLGKLLHSSDEVEVEVGQKIGVFFPNQDTNGTHINISGAALTKFGKNSEAATQLLEYLTGEEAQNNYASANYEYPVNQAVEPSDFLKSFGEFKTQDIDLSLLGEYNDKAVKIFNEVGWQ